jgi:Domain of Unknown Function (DUF349)
MGFLDLFRPKWRHSDVEVRAEAVRDLDDAALLSRVLEDDAEARIRRIALKKISDLDTLLRASEKDSDAGVREAAREKASERLLRSATSDDDDDALAALRRLTAERDLAQVVRTGQSSEARKTALERVSDERLLAEIARRAADNELRVAAAKRIRDPKLLEDLARSESHKGVALAVTDKLDDGRALGLVARGAKSAAARTAAKAKLEARGEHTEAPREISQQKKPPGTASAETKAKKALLLQITLAAESAARMGDLAVAERALADARARWNEVDPIPGTAALATRLEKATSELAARRAAEDRARELEAKRKEAKRAREEADAKAQKQKLEDEQRAKDAVAAAPPPPVAAATPEPRAPRVAPEEDEATRARREEQRLRRESERAGRIAALEKALPELEALVAAEHDVKDLKTLDKALKDLGPVVRGSGRGEPEGEEKELRQKGLALLDRLATRVSELHESERWRRWAKAPKPDELILEAEALAQVLGETEDKRRGPLVLRELSTKWKHAAGNAPTPKTQPLWDRFQAAVKKSEELLGEHFTKLEGDRAENLKKKEALAAAAEELRESTAWRETSEKLKALQTEWKAIGPVPNDQADAVWKRFRAACDQFFEARKAVEKVGAEEREANLKRKEELVVRAESLARSTQWKETAEELKRLQEDWEAIGPGPREQQNAVWKRFRAAFDTFFDARKAAFAQLDAERAENLKEKLLLCEKVEALAAGLDDDPEGVLEQVKVLQAEWKKVGPAPRGDQDAVWARFRGACDVIYAGPKFEPLPPGDTSGTAGFVNRLPLEKIAAQLSTPAGDDRGGDDENDENDQQDEISPPRA